MVGVAIGGPGTLLTSQPAAATIAGTAPIGGTRYVSVSPERLLDSRVEGADRIRANQPFTLTVSDNPSVAAAVLNITLVDAAGPGHVTVTPAGTSIPTTSVLNAFYSGQTVASMTTARLGSGAVTIVSSVEADIVVDLLGVYELSSRAAAGRFVPIAPRRALDTRLTGAPLTAQSTTRVDLSTIVPATGAVAVVNLTAVDAPAGFWTATASGLPVPTTSNLNVASAGETVANQAFVGLANGALDVFSHAGGHLLVDVVGYMTGEQAPASVDGLFVPVQPTRVLDTRNAGSLNPLADRMRSRAEMTLDVRVAGSAGVPASAAAIAMTVTAVHANNPGFVTVWPAGTEAPSISNLNASRRGQIVANHAVTTVSVRGVSLRPSTSTHLLADVTGWYVGRPVATTVPFKQPKISTTEGRIVIPAIGLDQPHQSGWSDDELDEGPLHWLFSSLPGELGTTMILGHRSTHSAPFRRIGELKNGDLIEITDQSGRHSYRVTERRVVRPEEVEALVIDDTENVLLVACHPIGSTELRIVVRGVAV